MQVRFLRYFVAVAREGHFGRAAQLCRVTQPTLSAGIVALERQLGRRLVVRERRFTGLTPEGQAILPWAQQLLAAFDGMTHAADAATGPLRGEFRLGAIPAAMPITGPFADILLAGNPELTVRIHSHTSREIEALLADFELDAGLTYLDHEPPTGVLTVPLYAEHYVCLVHAGSSLAARDKVAWDDVLRQPLCLLHQGMQNRRILDARLAERGLAVTPRAQADSYVALLAMVRTGHFATIVPDSYTALLPDIPWAAFRPLSDPIAASRIGLAISRRDPLGPMAAAALRVARQMQPDEGS